MEEEKILYELCNHHIILNIPEHTVRLKINAYCVGEDGTLFECHSTIDGDALARARTDFIDYVGDDDYDAVYTITEKGLEYLANLEDDRK